MSRTTSVFVRVEPEIKEQAELILKKLGIPMTSAVSMYLRQIVLQQGIPFEVKLPHTAPLSVGSLNREQFDAEIEAGLSDLDNGRSFSAEEVESEMNRDCGRDIKTQLEESDEM